jgi:hypothetical protein
MGQVSRANADDKKSEHHPQGKPDYAQDHIRPETHAQDTSSDIERE